MTYWRIKANYDAGLWTKGMVHKAVEKGIITPEQYTLITKEEYKNDRAES